MNNGKISSAERQIMLDFESRHCLYVDRIRLANFGLLCNNNIIIENDNLQNGTFKQNSFKIPISLIYNN